MDLVAQLVQDHLTIFGVVHAALAEAHLILGMVSREGVVLRPTG